MRNLQIPYVTSRISALRIAGSLGRSNLLPFLLRLPVEKQVELVPSVLAGIEAKPTMHQVCVCMYVRVCLFEVKLTICQIFNKQKIIGLSNSEAYFESCKQYYHCIFFPVR